MVGGKSTIENRHKPAPVLDLLDFAKLPHSNRVCIEHTLLLKAATLFRGCSLLKKPGRDFLKTVRFYFHRTPKENPTFSLVRGYTFLK